jgi:AraC-like DNA-binding protein
MPAIFESWDLTVPPVPPRTRLYPLEPIGIGTPLVESLTGYVLRLAEAHALPVGALTRLELGRYTFTTIPDPLPQNKKNVYSGAPISYATNGVEEGAVKWTHALERVTLRKDLHLLTFLAFGNFFCSLSLFRRLRTWCPACFEEWRTSGDTIYEPLLWSLKVASVCPRHRERLISICPHCQRSMKPLTFFSCPGYCGRCDGWLGVLQEGVEREKISAASTEYWVSNSAGELLALAPQGKLDSGLLRRAFRKNFEACVNNLFRGNRSACAKFIGCTATSVYNWRNGAAAPGIAQLLQLSERLRIPIGKFLRVRSAAGVRDWKFIKPAASGYAPPIIRHRPAQETRRALKLALRERPSPSLTEVARRLNYRGTEGLRNIGRSLCKRITDNYKRSFAPEPYYNGPRPRICDRKEIGAALKAALAQDDPESVPRIARRLGYASSGPFLAQFPGLCREIHAKIAKQKKARIRAMRRIVKQALRQNPPPALRQLVVRLGYKDKKVIGHYFGALSAELLARRKAFKEREAAQLRRRLQRCTCKEPPPSMGEVCRKLGLKNITASRKFPNEYRIIVTRFLQRRNETARRRQVWPKSVEYRGQI